jgi:peptide/nickel transport system permease protein
MSGVNIGWLVTRLANDYRVLWGKSQCAVHPAKRGYIVTNYIIRRILLLIPTMFIVSVIVFFLVRYVPGSAVDVIAAYLSQGGTVQIDRAAIAHSLGLDVPAHVQYVRWMGNIILHGDFGNSIIQGKPVFQIVWQRMPVTLELGIMAMIISIVIGIPLGTYSAIRQDSWGDYSGRTISILLISIPSFWVATLIMIYPAIWWGWAPPMELIPFTEDPIGNLGMFLIPAAILGTSTAGGLMRLQRTMMLEVMRQDYIRTSWAKGLTEMVIIMRHAIKNAFIPVITILGGQVAMLIGGAVIIENIFSLPGMGQLALQSLNQRDYPLISAITLITAAFVMICNLVVDITYSWLDPRIRYK